MARTKDSGAGGRPLARIEYRTGAFIWTASGGRVSLGTLSDVFYFRISTATAAGSFLAMAVEKARKGDEGAGRFLAAYAAVMLQVHSAVPCHDAAEGDVPGFVFLSALHGAALEAVRRHPAVYGVPEKPVTDEEDAKVLEEERRLREAEDSLKQDSSKDSLKS